MTATEAISRPERHRITIVDSGETYDCAPLQNLLKTMVALGRKGIPSGCHGGGCGVCKIQVLTGKYRTLRMSRAHISADDERRRIVLACRTMPRSDLSLTPIGKLNKALTQPRYGFV